MIVEVNDGIRLDRGSIPLICSIKIKYWSSGVVVNMPPCHGGDHRSESGRDRNGSIAQLVEQRIEAPCVGGSIPSRAIRKQEVAGIV